MLERRRTDVLVGERRHAALSPSAKVTRATALQMCDALVKALLLRCFWLSCRRRQVCWAANGQGGTSISHPSLLSFFSSS